VNDIEKRATSIEMTSQVVRREGADEMLAYMESLNAEKTAVKKAVDYLKAWHPEDIEATKNMRGKSGTEKQDMMAAADRAVKMARSVKDPMRLVLNHVQFYKGLEVKQGKLKGETEDALDALSDDQVKQLAAVIKGEAVVIPTETEAEVVE